MFLFNFISLFFADCHKASNDGSNELVETKARKKTFRDRYPWKKIETKNNFLQTDKCDPKKNLLYNEGKQSEEGANEKFLNVKPKETFLNTEHTSSEAKEDLGSNDKALNTTKNISEQQKKSSDVGEDNSVACFKMKNKSEQQKKSSDVGEENSVACFVIDKVLEKKASPPEQMKNDSSECEEGTVCCNPISFLTIDQAMKKKKSASKQSKNGSSEGEEEKSTKKTKSAKKRTKKSESESECFSNEKSAKSKKSPYKVSNMSSIEGEEDAGCCLSNNRTSKKRRRPGIRKLCMKMTAYGETHRRYSFTAIRMYSNKDKMDDHSKENNHKNCLENKPSKESKADQSNKGETQQEKLSLLEDCTMETMIAELCRMKRKRLEAAKAKESKDDHVDEELPKGDKIKGSKHPEQEESKCDGEKCFKEYAEIQAKKAAKKSAKLCPLLESDDKPKKKCDKEKHKKNNAKDGKGSGVNQCSPCQNPSPPILAPAPEDCNDNKPVITEKQDRKKSTESDLSLANQCNELCAVCNSTKTIPYEEGKEFEKCVDPELLICEEKIVGNCRHLICKPMGKPKPLSEMGEVKKEEETKKDDKGARLLKCKAIQDESGKEVLICKVINLSSKKGDAEKQIEAEIKKTKDDCGKKHKKKSKNITISKQLVCKEEEIATTGSKEMCCNVLEVREISDSEGGVKIIKKKAEGRKPSPFTYQDLLKRSEEVRRATEEELAMEANKKSNKKDINC